MLLLIARGVMRSDCFDDVPARLRLVQVVNYRSSLRDVQASQERFPNSDKVGRARLVREFYAIEPDLSVPAKDCPRGPRIHSAVGPGLAGGW